MSNHIIQLAASGIKGREFSYELSRLVLITGPNFSGKSSIVDAVRLALLGYLPELGRQNAATFSLCSGNIMTVKAMLHGGEIYDRQWRFDGKTVSLASKDAGGMEGLPLMNPGEYFALSPAKRIDFIFSKIQPPAGYDLARVTAALHEIEEEATDWTTTDEDALNQVKAWAAKELKPETFNSDLVALNDQKSGTLGVKESEWNKKAKDTIGAVRTLQDMNGYKEEFSEAVIAQRAKVIDDTQTMLSKASEVIGDLKARIRTAGKQAERRVEIEAELAELAQDRDEPISRLVAKRWELDSRRVGIDQDALAKTATEYHDAVDRGSELWKRIASHDDNSAEAICRLAELETMECCPTCGAKGKNFKKAMTESLNLTIERITASRATDISDSEATKGRECALRGILDAAMQQEAANLALTKEMEAIDEELKALRKTDAEAGQRRTLLESELHRMEPVEGVTPEALQATEDEQDRLEQALTDARAAHSMAVSRRASFQAAETALVEHEQAASFHKIIKASRKKVNKFQGEMIEAVFHEVCAAANRIAGDMLPSRLEFKDGEVGRRNEHGEFISHVAFSGTEQALAYISIAAALSSMAPFKLLILDEMGRLTPKMQGAILTRFAAVVEAGALDQVICVIPRDKEPTAPGWQVINLGQ